MSGWTADDIPSCVGKVALITGANSGVGYVTAAELARHGARVLLAARSPERGEAAVERLRHEVRGANVAVVPLDLADLDDVARASERVAGLTDRLDVLVNNAGVMAVPEPRTTAQGFELQVGTNHLGHFALTGRLLGLLVHSGPARVVTVSSIAHRRAHLDVEHFESIAGYSPWVAYGSSKLANILFFTELDRRLRRAGAPVASVGAHPGIAVTNLASAGPRLSAEGRLAARVAAAATAAGTRLIGQSAARGALPILYGSVSSQVEGGAYIGPGGPGELRGAPKAAVIRPNGRNLAVAARLFERSVELTGVDYGELDRATGPAAP